MIILSSADILKINSFKKFFQEQLSECQFGSRSGQKNKCVSLYGSQNLSKDRHTFFFIIFFSGIFLEKNIIFCILNFKMHKIIYFFRTPEKLGFTSKFR